MIDSTRATIVFMLTGLVCGLLAALFIDEMTLVQYLLSGVAGSLIGGYVSSMRGIRLGSLGPLATQIATSSVGALVVVLLVPMIE